MQQQWAKSGLLIPGAAGGPWAHSYASLPCALSDGERLAVYYSPRDALGRAHVALAFADKHEPTGELVLIEDEGAPVLSPGPLGAFDDSGTTNSCVAQFENDTYLYYSGWTLGVSVPFYFYVGLAVRPCGESLFQRVSAAPILERNAIDPYLTASPWVLRDSGSWRMWYVSCVDWKLVQGQPRHRYHIRYAESSDGVTWRRNGRVSIDFADESEYAISRPCVVRDGDCYRMWFAARGESYRIGYAESADGLSWTRDDSAVGLEPSAEGWDSEMIAYPAIADHRGNRYLLYNGNGYGRTGAGYAIAIASARQTA